MYPGGGQHIQQGIAALFQRPDFLVAHVGVDLLQLSQAADFLAEFLTHLFRRRLHVGGQFVRGLVFSFLEQFAQAALVAGDDLAHGVAAEVHRQAPELVVGPVVAAIPAFGVEQHVQQDRRQEAEHLQGRRGHAVDAEVAFEQQAAGGQSRQLAHAERGVAPFALQQQIQRADDHGMLPGDEQAILVDQRSMAIEGEGGALGVQFGEAMHLHVIAGAQDQVVAGVFLHLDAEGVGQAGEIVVEKGIGVLFADGRHQRFGDFGTIGVEFQQAIAAFLQAPVDAFEHGAGLREQFPDRIR